MELSLLWEKSIANWPIKVTALVLATVLWASGPTTEEPTTQLVPVRLNVIPPQGYSLRQSPSEIQALYGGAPGELIKVYEAAPRIDIVVADTITQPFYTVDLTPQAVVLDSDADVLIQDIIPRRVVILLEEVVDRRVTVAPRVIIRPDEGFEVTSDITVEPQTVIVTGPAGTMERLDTVYTAPIEISNVRQPISLTVAIDTSGVGAVALSVHDVTVTALIESVSDTLIVRLPITADEGSWPDSLPEVEIVIIGPASRLNSLPLDSILVTLGSPDSAATATPIVVTGPRGLTYIPNPDSLRTTPDSTVR